MHILLRKERLRVHQLHQQSSMADSPRLSRPGTKSYFGSGKLPVSGLKLIAPAERRRPSLGRSVGLCGCCQGEKLSLTPRKTRPKERTFISAFREAATTGERRKTHKNGIGRTRASVSGVRLQAGELVSHRTRTDLQENGPQSKLAMPANFCICR